MVRKLKQININSNYVLISMCFLTYFMWSLLIPFNQAPDEIMRYDIPKFIFENGTLPHGGDPSIRNPIWGISYAFTPILSYMCSSLLMKVQYFFTQDVEKLYLAARFFSVLCSTGTVYFLLKIADKLFDKKYKYLFVVLVALWPQFIFISCYINNDSLAIFATSIIIYFWICGMESRWKIRDCIGLAIGISLCALSYYNAYSFILCSMIIFIVSCKVSKQTIKGFLGKVSIMAVIILLLSGWWFIRNAYLYNGDFLGMSTSNYFSEQFAVQELKPSNRLTPSNTGISLYTMLIDMGWIKQSYISFIGLFGYMNVSLNKWVYEVYTGIIGIGLAGILLQLGSNRKDMKKNEMLLNIMFIISIAITIGLSVFYSYTSDFQPQGRYILPAIIPIMYFLSKGIGYILQEINKKVKGTVPYVDIVIISLMLLPIIITQTTIMVTYY